MLALAPATPDKVEAGAGDLAVGQAERAPAHGTCATGPIARAASPAPELVQDVTSRESVLEMIQRQADSSLRLIITKAGLIHEDCLLTSDLQQRAMLALGFEYRPDTAPISPPYLPDTAPISPPYFPYVGEVARRRPRRRTRSAPPSYPPPRHPPPPPRSPRTRSRSWSHRL